MNKVIAFFLAIIIFVLTFIVMIFDPLGWQINNKIIWLLSGAISFLIFCAPNTANLGIGLKITLLTLSILLGPASLFSLLLGYILIPNKITTPSLPVSKPRGFEDMG
jgi:O-antigen ligase